MATLAALGAKLIVMACWAECLGQCSDKMSREHLVSASIFPQGKIRVQGFPWCIEEPKEIGISGLTAKLLCVRHNNALSPVDDGGRSAFEVFKEIRRLANVRNAMKPRRWNVVTHRIDGLMLERWFLKTLINICCDGEWPIGRASNVPGRPHDALVRIAYGHEEFENRAGLYFLAKTGMRVESADTILFSPLVKEQHHIEGGLFTFRGQGFLLYLESEGPPEPLTGIMWNADDLGGVQLNLHNKKIDVFDREKNRSQVLLIKWKG